MSDLISRAVAIDALKNRWKKTRNYEGIGDDIAEECELCLKQVPSAQPGQKKGEWIPYLPEGLRYKCSECESKYETPWHFCPNCGADMRGEQDG